MLVRTSPTIIAKPMFSDRTRWNREENPIARALAARRAAGAQVLDLAESNPTACGFVYDRALSRAFESAELLNYRPDPRGIVSAREAVSEYYRERAAPLSPEELILTSGTSEGYSFVFRLLCNPGDEILIPSPGYPLFDFLADLSDVRLCRYPLVYDHGWQIDFSALQGAVTARTRAVVVVHPNNPTGHYSAARERQRLARFCREQGVALIADEVFLDFPIDEALPVSFASSNESLAFTLSGVSKICGLPQMKLAWIAVSGPEKEKQEALGRLEVIADAYLSVGTPVQVAAPALLGTRRGFQRQALGRIRSNLAALDAQLGGQTVSGRLECQGGWNAVLRVPALGSDEELAGALLTETGVHLHPGHFYDFAPGHLIVSLIVPESDFSRGIGEVLSYVSR
jgi:alanine-synthesizing transaminase